MLQPTAHSRLADVVIAADVASNAITPAKLSFKRRVMEVVSTVNSDRKFSDPAPVIHKTVFSVFAVSAPDTSATAELEFICDA